MEVEDLICPICMDFFTGNVRITKCGHNYCEGCLTGMVSADETTWPCPECRTSQTEHPADLTRNYIVERSVVKQKSSKKNFCATHELQKKLCKYLNRSKYHLKSRDFSIYFFRLSRTRAKSLP